MEIPNVPNPENSKYFTPCNRIDGLKLLKSFMKHVISIDIASIESFIVRCGIFLFFLMSIGYCFLSQTLLRKICLEQHAVFCVIIYIQSFRANLHVHVQARLRYNTCISWYYRLHTQLTRYMRIISRYVCTTHASVRTSPIQYQCVYLALFASVVTRNKHYFFLLFANSRRYFRTQGQRY